MGLTKSQFGLIRPVDVFDDFFSILRIDYDYGLYFLSCYNFEILIFIVLGRLNELGPNYPFNTSTIHIQYPLSTIHIHYPLSYTLYPKSDLLVLSWFYSIFPPTQFKSVLLDFRANSF